MEAACLVPTKEETTETRAAKLCHCNRATELRNPELPPAQFHHSECKILPLENLLSSLSLPTLTSPKVHALYTLKPFFKKINVFFLTQKTNIKIYLEICKKIKQKQDAFKKDSVLLGQESRKPDEDVIDLALTEPLSGTNKPSSSCLPLPSIPKAHQKKVKISRAFINRSVFALHIAVKHWRTEEPKGGNSKRAESKQSLFHSLVPHNSDTHRPKSTPGLKRTFFHVPFAVKEAKGFQDLLLRCLFGFQPYPDPNKRKSFLPSLHQVINTGMLVGDQC